MILRREGWQSQTSWHFGRVLSEKRSLVAVLGHFVRSGGFSYREAFLSLEAGHAS